MKILVLMPLDEKSVYMAAGIKKELEVEADEKTFAMPMFMEYLITTKTSPNWLYAVFDSLVSAKQLYATAETTNDDLIIIGNAPKDLKFDAIFNFQDIEEDLPYKDEFVEKLKEVTTEDEKLSAYLDLHTADESIFTLHNCKATAKFLGAYLKTDPHLEEIEAEYQGLIQEKGKLN